MQNAAVDDLSLAELYLCTFLFFLETRGKTLEEVDIVFG